MPTISEKPLGWLRSPLDATLTELYRQETYRDDFGVLCVSAVVSTARRRVH